MWYCCLWPIMYEYAYVPSTLYFVFICVSYFFRCRVYPMNVKNYNKKLLIKIMLNKSKYIYNYLIKFWENFFLFQKWNSTYFILSIRKQFGYNFRLRPKNRPSSGIQDVTQKELKLLTRMNKRLDDLKNRMNTTETDED